MAGRDACVAPILVLRAFPFLPGRRKRPHPTSTQPPPLHLAGDFVDNFFIGDVTFDGGLTNEEEGCADE